MIDGRKAVNTELYPIDSNGTCRADAQPSSGTVP